ncbi:AzlD domain-containing protein [Desulfofundulus thermosubterraneus]|uniref:Branched-chain amino acid transport protein n=1 Tax=Desulfofundulus thermosubterraneus DSM 16057 TaxID=1121432 RepID=A0A1M6B8K8_9FIRM|nr:AzlD domain-containing protein [Desulfofundulus thermosubterraneus]SHI45045.1 Branched-chain amino acid transport protein [Desulfofundulus thermosubterraneus DSM 16057]
MEQTVWAIILGIAALNYLFRVTPLLLLSRVRIPSLWARWLGYVPVAVLAALVAPEIFLNGGVPALTLENKNLLAAIPTFLVAVKTRSLLFTLLTGVASMALFNALG